MSSVVYITIPRGTSVVVHESLRSALVYSRLRNRILFMALPSCPVLHDGKAFSNLSTDNKETKHATTGHCPQRQH